jgi:nicotinic acid mononucleotide adenylyltransferase
MIVGAYPGTYNPPTVAHLSIAEAAWRQGGLDRLDLLVSRDPLGKDAVGPSLDDRMRILGVIASTRSWLDVRVTDDRLISDVAAGYDAVVVGVDK